MIERWLEARALDDLRHFPVVALMGPRQVGKTTLARRLAEVCPKQTVHLDLERASDRAKLNDAEAYYAAHAGELIVLDEIQFVPELFSLLRSIVDERIRAGEPSAHFLVLGSASRDLLRQSSESLAGRIAFRELNSLSALETRPQTRGDLEAMWLRGGMPPSFLASTDAVSWRWREQFIATYVERDIPLLGPQAPPEQLRRLWSMIAHGQGVALNASRLATGLGLSSKTVARYIDILTDLFMVRQLQDWAGSSRKRLMKAPKVYVRDSGLLHALVKVTDLETLLGHPICGRSWEGFAIEQLLTHLPSTWTPSYYRTSAGAEIDLVLEGPRSRVLAIEIKRTTAPTLRKGFLLGAEDVGATERWFVTPWGEEFPLGHDVRAVALLDLVARLASEPV